jgi:hypothetical protein
VRIRLGQEDRQGYCCDNPNDKADEEEVGHCVATVSIHGCPSH